MNIVKLRLNRKERAIPFSLAYLFRGGDLDGMRARFETFLGFPARHFDHPLEDVVLRGKSLGEWIPDLRVPEGDWHVAVPILTAKSVHWALRARKKRGEGDPREVPESLPETKLDEWGEEAGPYVMYITERGWKNWVQKDKDKPPVAVGAYPETGYLSTVGGVVRPPCFACPRMLLHQAGECALGDRVCFSFLTDFKAQGQLARKLVEYENLTLEETESVLDQIPD